MVIYLEIYTQKVSKCLFHDYLFRFSNHLFYDLIYSQVFKDEVTSQSLHLLLLSFEAPDLTFYLSILL
jgi:hypothetical protein